MPASVYSRVARKRKFSPLSVRLAVEVVRFHLFPHFKLHFPISLAQAQSPLYQSLFPSCSPLHYPFPVPPSPYLHPSPLTMTGLLLATCVEYILGQWNWPGWRHWSNLLQTDETASALRVSTESTLLCKLIKLASNDVNRSISLTQAVEYNNNYLQILHFWGGWKQIPWQSRQLITLQITDGKKMAYETVEHFNACAKSTCRKVWKSNNLTKLPASVLKHCFGYKIWTWDECNLTVAFLLKRFLKMLTFRHSAGLKKPNLLVFS